MKVAKINLKGIFDKNNLKDLIRTTLFALIITLVAVLIFGIILKFIDLSNDIVMPINQVIKVVSILVASLLGVKQKSHGAIKGALCGLLYTLVSIFIFLILGNSLKDSFSLIDLLMGTIIGAICGIIAINTGKRRI